MLPSLSISNIQAPNSMFYVLVNVLRMLYMRHPWVYSQDWITQHNQEQAVLNMVESEVRGAGGYAVWTALYPT